jgi:hypothetical protein
MAKCNALGMKCVPIDSASTWAAAAAAVYCIADDRVAHGAQMDP